MLGLAFLCVAALDRAALDGLSRDELISRLLAHEKSDEIVSRVVPLGDPFEPHPGKHTGTMRVAAVQMGDFVDGVKRTGAQETADRTAKVVKYMREAAALGARVIVFPEMALTLYDKAAVANTTQADFAQAEATVAAECASLGVYAIVGVPKFLPPGTPAGPNCGAGENW